MHNVHITVVSTCIWFLKSFRVLQFRIFTHMNAVVNKIWKLLRLRILILFEGPQSNDQSYFVHTFNYEHTMVIIAVLVINDIWSPEVKSYAQIIKLWYDINHRNARYCLSDCVSMSRRFWLRTYMCK